MKPNIDLEVWYDPDRDHWQVRHFGGDPLRVWAVWQTKEFATQSAIALANVFAEEVNPPKPGQTIGSCEVYFRNLDGTLAERNTYGYDPEKSKG